jgi:Ca2+-binding RTX toxin-like protein
MSSPSGRTRSQTKNSRGTRIREKLLRFESLEPRRLLAVDAVDDVFTANSYVSNGAFLGVTQNDVRTNPQLSSTITEVSATALGAQVQISGDGILYYPPDISFGQDTFTYTVTDGTTGGEDTATVTVHLFDGYLQESILVRQVAVPGEINTLIYRIHDLPSGANVPPTFSSTMTWDDGVVTQAHVSRTVLENNDVEVLLSFWRTFASPRTYNATWTISKSDGTQTTSPFFVDVRTIMQRFFGQSETELVIGGLAGVNNQIMLLPASSGTKFVPPGVSMVVNEPAMRVYYNGSDMGAFVAGRVVIYGQGGNDLIQVDAGITTNAQLFGQAGNDTLVGGSGHDILAGSSGDDVLYGFNGRDLLFGGLGRDFLQGASWNGSATAADSDLLVGSFVTFDYDIYSLNDVAHRWQSAVSYNMGIDSIRGVFPWLRQNVTVFDDWSLDYVFGAGELDWFWVEPTRDNFDAQGNELVN